MMISNRTPKPHQPILQVERAEARNLLGLSNEPGPLVEALSFTTSIPRRYASEWELAISSSMPVLITGATGSGKTELAKRIYSDSAPEKRGKWVEVNLASINPNLIETELFGHERGSFTSAVSSKRGRIEEAAGGTLFLDEIAELPVETQVRLLEFLQNRTMTRVGGLKSRQIQCRIIAATQRDLEQAVAEREFREDLLHRLRVIHIELPKLSECSSAELDHQIHTVLAEVAVHKEKKIMRISIEAASALESYSWPGNFRELRNVLEFAVASSSTETLELEALPAWFRRNVERLQRSIDVELPQKWAFMQYKELFDALERQYLMEAWKRARGRLTPTVRMTGIPKTTLIRRLKDFEIGNGL